MAGRLYSAYLRVRRPASREDGVVAEKISGRAADFICAGRQGQPTLLLSCRTSTESKRPPIRLRHVSIEFGVRYKVSESGSVIDDEFVVIALRDQSMDLDEIFCLVAETFVAGLEKAPSVIDVERLVGEFVELLSCLEMPSGRIVSGLWAELWLISCAADKAAAVSAWRLASSDRFDFCFPDLLVEVKATEQSERSHEFAYEQLRQSDRPIRLLSLMLRRAASGKSLLELIDLVKADLPQELREKVVRNAFRSVGSAISESAEIRFDDSFAHDNLRSIDALSLPIFVLPTMSPISAVRFRMNLDDTS